MAHVCAVAAALALILAMPKMAGAPGGLSYYSIALATLTLLFAIPLVLVCPLMFLVNKIQLSLLRARVGSAARADAFPGQFVGWGVWSVCGQCVGCGQCVVVVSVSVVVCGRCLVVVSMLVVVCGQCVIVVSVWVVRVWSVCGRGQCVGCSVWLVCGRCSSGPIVSDVVPWWWSVWVMPLWFVCGPGQCVIVVSV